MLALGGRRLRIMGLFGLGPGLLDGGVHTLEVPLLIASRDEVPDLRLRTVGGVHAHKVDVLVGQHVADAGPAIAGSLERPALAQSAGAAPLMEPGAFHHAAEGEVHHFAGKTVLDAPASFACIHEFPLLPRMTCVVPQTDRSAVLRVEVLYFQHLSIGGLDEVKFIF